MRRFRVQHRRSRTSPYGAHAQTLGLRVGYWPCLRGPFVCIEVLSHRWDLWHGLPGYETT